MMKDKDYRTLIIQAAGDVIHCEGLKSLTIANIVQRCKISNRNFYENFSSKEELLLEIRKLYSLEGFEVPDEKQTILEKAEEMISRNGFNNITLEKIAKAAGLKRGAIYKHFVDKYELLEACIEFQFNKTKQIVDMIYKAEGHDPENYIRTYVENYAYFLNHTFEQSIFTESWSHMNYRPRIRALVMELQEHFRMQIVQSLQSGIEQGVFKKDLDLLPVSDYITMTINAMAFYISKRTMPEQRVSKELVELTVNTIFKMIKVEEAK